MWSPTQHMSLNETVNLANFPPTDTKIAKTESWSRCKPPGIDCSLGLSAGRPLQALTNTVIS